MIDELRELYQEVILDHNKNPKNYFHMENPTHSAEGHNPLCGDQVEVFLNVEGDVITNISFQGHGCAISKAASSVMTTVLKGKTIAEAKEWFNRYQHLVTSDMGEVVDFDAFGQLAVFAGVREFPMRVKCASLSWHTMLQALENKNEVASTE
ncbi:MAG: SUF system NifU family Fe-S cluster assembly protein [Deferribacteres bacterium]|nr:SUF system NifU family Fe-S cluster assembly protein [candidate division KSB1 bacterium]MCB9503964.1 SUF system NifU family Fe-S cluster assembly protein [Deferribacteres bacterium]